MPLTIENRLDRMDAKLNALAGKMNKETWVKVGWVKTVTGWDKEKLRKAREQGIVKFRKSKNGIEYLLESIPAIFIKKNEAI
jgi:hypothetical protein